MEIIIAILIGAVIGFIVGILVRKNNKQKAEEILNKIDAFIDRNDTVEEVKAKIEKIKTEFGLK